MSEKQEEADFYMDQFMNDFPGEYLNLGEDIMNPDVVISAITAFYANKGKALKPY